MKIGGALSEHQKESTGGISCIWLDSCNRPLRSNTTTRPQVRQSSVRGRFKLAAHWLTLKLWLTVKIRHIGYKFVNTL